MRPMLQKSVFLPKAAPSGELGLLDTVNVFYAFGEEYRLPAIAEIFTKIGVQRLEETGFKLG